MITEVKFSKRLNCFTIVGVRACGNGNDALYGQSHDFIEAINKAKESFDPIPITRENIDYVNKRAVFTNGEDADFEREPTINCIAGIAEAIFETKAKIIE